jgi:hypothetical protein
MKVKDDKQRHNQRAFSANLLARKVTGSVVPVSEIPLALEGRATSAPYPSYSARHGGTYWRWSRQGGLEHLEMGFRAT